MKGRKSMTVFFRDAWGKLLFAKDRDGLPGIGAIVMNTHPAALYEVVEHVAGADRPTVIVRPVKPINELAGPGEGRATVCG